MASVTSADGTAIGYDSAGEGPAVIFVDGATAYRAVGETTAKLQGLLASSGYTAIRYDRRGRGDSGDTQPYAPEREFEDLEALVAEAGGEASAFGMSSGAVLVAEAASRGVPLEKLALYEPPCLLDRDGPEPDPEYVERLERLAAEGTGEAMTHFMQNVAGMPAEDVAEFRASPAWPAFEAVEHTLAYDGRIMDPFNKGEPIPPGHWAAVVQPSLVFAGGDSPEWMQRAAAKVAEALPSGEVRTLPGQTHRFDPEVLAPVMLEFLSG